MNPFRGWMSVFVLLGALILSLAISLGSIFLYNYFLLGISPPEAIRSATLVLLDSTAALTFQILLTNLSFVLAILYGIKVFDLPLVKVFPMRPVGWRLGAGAVLGSASLSVLSDQLLYWLLPKEGHRPVGVLLNLDQLTQGWTLLSVASILLLLLMVLLANPVAEELFFRGIVWHCFRSQHSFLTATLLSALLGGMLRLDPAGSISTSILGVYYGTLLEKTGSLWPAILGSITVSLLTFALSQFGLRYGYGGEPYPVSWLVVAGAVAVAVMVALLCKPPRTGKPD